jgi:hypothetical protein
MRNLAIYDTATGIVQGTLDADIVPDPAPGYAYADYTPGTDPRGMKAQAGRVLPNSLVVVPETAEQALSRMIVSIDSEREVRMMTQLTDGGAKKYEYAEKAREVRDYRGLSGSVVGSLLIPLNLTGTRERFAWAMAEVEETGDTLEVVITRYETAMKSVALARKVAARAQKLKRTIRAAVPAARDAIYQARAWPTS